MFSIESTANPRAREVFSCSQATTSVYALRIHWRATLPPRVKPVQFGQDKIRSASAHMGRNYCRLVYRASADTSLGRNPGQTGGFN